MKRKRCSRCKDKKALSKFALKKTGPDGRTSECKECHNIIRRNYYLRNKEKEYARIKERKKELLAWLRKLKQGFKCERCPEKEIVCLDFHHKNPETKELTIARVVSNGWSRERILKEIKKCIVLCSNCHKKLHASIT